MPQLTTNRNRVQVFLLMHFYSRKLSMKNDQQLFFCPSLSRDHPSAKAIIVLEPSLVYHWNTAYKKAVNSLFVSGPFFLSFPLCKARARTHEPRNKHVRGTSRRAWSAQERRKMQCVISEIKRSDSSTVSWRSRSFIKLETCARSL